MKWIACLSLVACSSSAPPPPERPVVAPIVIDAAEPDAPPPDAEAPQAVLDAPAWVFRYATAQRTETWTLRHAEGAALLEVQNAQGTQRYLGTATEGESLVLDVSTGTAKLSLDCMRAKRALSTKCNDTKAKKVEVLDCYHKDFKEPMPFGPAPGVEYVVEDRCNGYRLIAP